MANRLADEQSPYLLQHAHNPVDWYPWSDEPFERAAREHKPVLVSIGYAACHWCHVMERESFENDEVAAYMNEHFINIKVDREEHPDVDHLYMDAVQAIAGSGGWPLNVFVTPERVPFYGGTYFPPHNAFNRISWMELLRRMNEIWTQKPGEIKLQSDQMLQYLKQIAQVGGSSQANLPEDAGCKLIAENLLKQADKHYGGFGRAPKFPGSMALNYLLEFALYTGSEEAREQALHSLDAMMAGGIYDQLGGGFARYSTDDQWLAPHFEKMLYDNALLIITLCLAYDLTKDQRYKEVIEQTIDFVERELKHPSGIYYSALDADSEGIEGRYYTWTWEEWTAATGGSDPMSAQYFGVVEEGNWEHTNILHIATPLARLADQYHLSISQVKEHIDSLKRQLLEIREHRIRPLTDDKSLLSWNALMNLALTQAAISLNSEVYGARAAQHMDVLLTTFTDDGNTCHVWKNGKAKINANLDDYAYLISALMHVASIHNGEEYLKKAATLCQHVIDDFQQDDGVFFYYTSSRQQDIPVRKVDVYDGAIPSANAVMADNLLWLGLCLERADYTLQAKNMLRKMSETVLRYPYSFGYWATVMQRLKTGLKTVVISGYNIRKLVFELAATPAPHCYFLTSEKEISEIPILSKKNISGETLIFVCTEQECLAPVYTVNATLPLITANLNQLPMS